MANLAAAQDDESDALAIEEVAVNAQNGNDFEIAIRKWEELISKFPNYSRIGNAELNCGKCYLNSSDFEEAIPHFKTATQKLDAKATVALPESYLFLGYSQYKRGLQIQETDAERSNELISSAAKTFERQLKSFDDFKHNDQVYYFQGLAYEELANLVESGSDSMLEKAAASYEAMFAFNADTSFKLDGLFFVGNVYEKLGQLDKAMDKYREYIKLGADDPNFIEGHYRAAHTLYRKASEDEPVAFQENLNEAKQLFNKAAATQDFVFRNDAQYQSARCSHRLGQLEEAAQTYKLIADAGGEKADQSALQAGRIFRSLGNSRDAEKYLAKAMNAGGGVANQAALQLVNSKLAAGEPDQAFTLAVKQLEKSQTDEPFVAELMLRKAEAALAMDERKADSPQLFLDLYKAFPDHALNSEALYSAAFAYLETEQLDESEKLCNDFLNQYPEDRLLPDLLEVRADIHLLKKEFAQSEKLFEDLVLNYRDHKKNNTWKLRVGVVLAMQEKHEQTIQWLTPKADDFETAARQAEAWHWVGKSHLANESFEQAEAALKRALDADSDWAYARKTMLALSEAQTGLNKSEEARQTLAALKAKFPESSEMMVADYRAADAAYTNGDFVEAEKLYKEIVSGSPDWEFIPQCKLGLAWSQLELRKFDNAESSFTDILTEYSGTNVVPQALLGRGMCRRQNENAQGAIEDLQEYIKKSSADGQPIEARYELGLAQTQLNQSDAATETFASLLKDTPKHKFADRFHYELAWLYMNQEKAEESLAQFSAIADGFPDSDLAPEANFKIGEKAYADENYEAAIEPFRLCMNSGGEETLREKAAYRVGWCFYKQKNFDQARENFQLQAKNFEGGRYYADAMFMIAESFYNQNQMPKAFAAYQDTQNAIDAGGKVVEKNVWLTQLHGAVSGNQANGFEQALQFADQLLESDASEGLKLEGWLEKGLAHKGLSQNAQAMEALVQSAKDRSTDVGAKSRCMIGDIHLIEQNHDKAIEAYTNVFYGYGGSKEDEKVDPWQAYAYYHAALCSFARIQQARDDGNKELSNKHASDAKKLYEKLLAEHPQSEFAVQAQKNLETIQRLQR
jgi:TolA-binding protein